MKIRNFYIPLMVFGLLFLSSESTQAQVCGALGLGPGCVGNADLANDAVGTRTIRNRFVAGVDLRRFNGRAATLVVDNLPGFADFANIQQAINFLPAVGGSVYIREGIYTVDTSIVVPSRVSLIGTGFATSIELANGVNLPAIVNADPVNGNSQIIISNLRLDGNKAQNNAGSGIDFQKVDNSRIEGCYIFNFPGDGISMSNQCVANALVANHCHFNNQSGICLSGGSYVNTVWGNHLTENVQYALYLLGPDTRLNYVFGNLCGVSGLSGIYLEGSNSNTLSANHCAANTQNGIYLHMSDANSITGNQCRINNIDGVHLEEGNKNTLSANQCEANADNGIYLFYSNDNALSGNQCNDNTNDGIILINSSTNVLGDSRCLGNGSNGIDISNAACSQNLVDGNIYQGNIAVGLANGGTATVIGDNIGP